MRFSNSALSAHSRVGLRGVRVKGVSAETVLRLRGRAQVRTYVSAGHSYSAREFTVLRQIASNDLATGSPGNAINISR